MASHTPDWTCPRCGLEGGHLRTPDPKRCKECCAVDAAPDLLAALKDLEAINVMVAGMGREWEALKAARINARAAIAKAEGRQP